MQNREQLDPRAFLPSSSNLWILKDSNNPKAPLMRGNVIIPIRMIDFVNQMSIHYPIAGEQCLKFSIAFWEAKEEFYGSSPPAYVGKVTVYTPGFEDKDLGERYRLANHISNIKLDRGMYR